MSESVPVGWEVKPIGNCCDILDSKRVPINSQERAKRKGIYPYYGANGVQDYINDYIFEEETILLAEDGGNFEQYAERPIAYMVSGKYWVNNHAHILKAKGEHINHFVFYSIVHKNILKYINGGTRSKLNQSDLREILILTPPLPEQQKIASILTSVDTVIEKTESQINKLKDLKKAMMQELLTKGIGHTEFKDSPVGRIPRSWDLHLLDDICNFTQGVQLPSHELSREHKKGYIRYLYIRDFQSDKHMWYAQNIYPQKIVTKNDIVMANTGHSSGESFIGKEGVLSNNAFKISFDTKVLNPDYLFTFLQSGYFKMKIKQLFNTAGQPHVGHGNIARMPFPLPSIDEQNEISQSIISVNNAIDSISIKNSQLTNLKKSLMQDLLTGKVRVKV